jgi:hypothetical protein
MKLNLTFLSCVMIFILFSQYSNAEGVRGRLDGVGPYGLYPVSGIAVTVLAPMGRSSPSYSDYQGMYYIYGLTPGPYTLEIWIGNQPMVFNIMVIQGRALTDIVPIKVR